MVLSEKNGMNSHKWETTYSKWTWTDNSSSLDRPDMKAEEKQALLKKENAKARFKEVAVGTHCIECGQEKADQKDGKQCQRRTGRNVKDVCCGFLVLKYWWNTQRVNKQVPPEETEVPLTLTVTPPQKPAVETTSAPLPPASGPSPACDPSPACEPLTPESILGVTGQVAPGGPARPAVVNRRRRLTNQRLIDRFIRESLRCQTS